MTTTVFKDEVSLVIAGAAGTGILTIINVLTKVFKEEGYHLFATNEYMSRVRGGTNSAELRISSKRVAAFVDRIDILVPLDKDAIPHLKKRITHKTIIIGEKEAVGPDVPLIDVPFSKMARNLGNKVFANTVAAGTILGMFKADQKIIEEYMQKTFAAKGEEIVQRNIFAAKQGYEQGKKLSEQIVVTIAKNSSVRNELLMDGTQAMSMGALAGGCNFVSSYPMSPATGVLTFLAKNAATFSLFVDQAEDEIAAINAGLGAWYAGARALVTTSGGGFALMVEGVSLAGMLETPIVIHLSQRPGPATGLPTRTEQGDLEFALYAGHGEFPRVIYAPGTTKEAFELTAKAFDVADVFQVPVIIMTDQFLVDSLYNTPQFDLSSIKVNHHIIKTEKDYKRYAFTKNGISPRGVPGFGEGLVGVDSDEHDEEGHITESMDVRNLMVEKRLKKGELILKESIPPTLIGPKNYKTLVVSWGSTRTVVEEALATLGNKEVAALHFSQVYPIPQQAKAALTKAESIIVVENNATGQFAKLLKLYADVVPLHQILKYNGMPFSVEELTTQLKECISYG